MGDFGLPGVGAKPRRAQSTARVGNILILCSMIYPHNSIKSSNWSERAWTYQEAVLSRRRLALTEDQAYFECNTMSCCESFQGDVDLLYAKNKHDSLVFLHRGVFSGKERLRFKPAESHNHSLAGNMLRYIELIDNYSRRNLTFGGDSLYAFAGVARHLARPRFPLLHFWGIALPLPSLLKSPSGDRKYLSKGLL